MMAKLGRYILSPWEEKTDTHRRLSYARVSDTALVIAIVHMLWTVDVMSWETVLLVFVIAFRVPIIRALDRASPEKALEYFFGTAQSIVGKPKERVQHIPKPVIPPWGESNEDG